MSFQFVSILLQLIALNIPWYKQLCEMLNLPIYRHQIGVILCEQTKYEE